MSDSSWNVAPLVERLRLLREASLTARRRTPGPPKLPSRRVVADVLERCGAALFPHRLGGRELAADGVDFFVGRTLDMLLADLRTQVSIELQFTSGAAIDRVGATAAADAIVGRFAERLPACRETLERDVDATHRRDRSTPSIDELIVCHPGVRATVHHRLAHALHTAGAPLVARIVAAVSLSETGVDIHPAARIGERFSIHPGSGVVIGETAEIGAGVWLHHGVTLGEQGGSSNDAPTASDARHPTLEDDVVVYAGATLLGPIRIGRGAVIGGNVWLTRDVPPAARITQADARHDDFDGGAGI